VAAGRGCGVSDAHRNDEVHRLLRWYPKGWRERYSDELAALVEDTTGGGPPPPALRRSLAWSGLGERLRSAGLVGEPVSPTGMGVGPWLVGCAWAAFVFAGLVFAKLAEHWDAATPTGSHTVPMVSFDAVEALAVLSALAIVVGVVAALPALVRLLAAGGWPALRTRVFVAIGLTVTTGLAVTGLALWAHRVSVHADGAPGGYQLVAMGVALLFAATLAGWSVVGVAVARRIELSPPLRRLVISCASVVTLAMVGMTAAAATWWGALSKSAPWFLAGGRPGTAASPFDPTMVGTAVLMAVATLVAVYGTVQAARGWRAAGR